MKKNNKVAIVFILMIIFLLVMVTFVKATDDNGELGITPINNTETGNNEPANEPVNEPTIGGNNNTPTNNNTVLPQTGVEEDITVFIFIGICILSAVYAYIKIRKYNNIK